MINSKYCIKCGQQIVSDAEFCPSCGAPQSGESVSTSSSNHVEVANSVSPHNSWGNIIKRLYSNWLTINEPISRYDFWMGELFVFLAQIVLYMVVNTTITFLNQPLLWISDSLIPVISIALFIIGIIIFIFEVWTGIAIFTSCMRRLKDAAYPLWLMLLILIPFLGGIILLFFFCQPSVKNNTNTK